MKKAVVLGTFDGLHIGHRSVLGAAAGYENTALTFEIPPKSVMSGETELLMTPKRRFEGLKSLGVQNVVALNFEDVKNTLPIDFLNMIKNVYAPNLIACGFNYRFGKGAAGDTALLNSFCNNNNIRFICCEPVKVLGEPISSSRIRELIKNGDMASATAEIYGGFCFSAPVINGDHRGRTLGYPTINQKYPQNLVLPKFGVYAVKVVLDGAVYNGIANIGVRPTYKTKEVYSETYIKNFSGNLYGKTVTIVPTRFIREEREFSSVEELKNAIEQDLKKLAE